MKIHDISPPVSAGMPVWPGDTPYDYRLVARIADGDAVNVGRVVMSVHTGAHTDAPRHFADDAPDIASVPLEAYVGPCVVVNVRPEDRAVRPEHLPNDLAEALSEAPRLLLRTYAERPAGFDEQMAHATPELAAWLADRGVRLLGIDSDSMDAFESKTLPAHHALLRREIAILEGIDLSEVSPGRYELVALPLRLVGADASPVRAILIEN